VHKSQRCDAFYKVTNFSVGFTIGFTNRLKGLWTIPRNQIGDKRNGHRTLLRPSAEKTPLGIPRIRVSDDMVEAINMDVDWSDLAKVVPWRWLSLLLVMLNLGLYLPDGIV
jgi:hypothetical protein